MTVSAVNTRIIIILAALNLAMLLLLSGCGNKGPLYLPEQADEEEIQNSASAAPPEHER